MVWLFPILVKEKKTIEITRSDVDSIISLNNLSKNRKDWL